ncbi:MAG: YHYH protein [Fimbriimonadaceae bacterium]|nr:YHYH protein [Fimbriimonadaceae bacterium]
MIKINSFSTLVTALFVGSGVAGAYYAQDAKTKAAEVAKPFVKFAPNVKTHSDDKNFFVESNGLPDHEMMTGITAWQQQVPLPQKYTGANAWQFPLFPVPAKKPMSAKTNFFRGAIAIAANGVPIFNPIKNDGRTDTFLAGELDKWGGHSGRGDDYHYHIPPLILQEKLGKSLPIAYALDGYAIYGLTEPDGTTPKDLDSFNGHTTSKLGYHYHATKTYPYLNGGFHGEVTERGGQVDPQPRATSPREATSPLRGAKITDFKTLEKGKSYTLTYTLDGNTSKVNYQVNSDGSVKFDFVDPSGNVKSETYKGRLERGGGGVGRQGGGGGRGGELGPPPGPRKPWFVDHAKGLDANKDGEVTKSEVTDQCKEAFKGYAGTSDFIKVEDLPNLRTFRNEIGGFMKVHAKELDQNGDGKITEQETIDTMLRMFDKQDKNSDGKLSGSELEG